MHAPTPRPRLLLVAATAVAATAGVVAPAPSAGAQDAPAPAQASWIDPTLDAVAVDGEAARTAQAAFDAVDARLAAAAAARVGAEAELTSLAARDVELTARIAERTADRKAASLRLVDARRAVQQVAAGAYVTSATYDDTSRLFDVGGAEGVATAQVLSRAVQEDRQREQDAARAELAAASADVQAAAEDRRDVRTRQVEVAEARDRAAADEAAAAAELEVRRAQLADARAVSRVRGMDFALVALDAYRRAAATQPACGIEWWAIAGISRVEGRHGTYGGADLTATGQVTRPIIGIPLDGANGTRAIADSDGGALDGDTVVDRAVGPMQFIPTTWARWGRDGDGDGTRDPQNLYDATAAAAAYLCNGRTLRDEAGLRAAYLSYNRSEAYVESVLGHARRYAAFTPPVTVATTPTAAP